MPVLPKYARQGADRHTDIQTYRQIERAFLAQFRHLSHFSVFSLMHWLSVFSLMRLVQLLLLKEISIFLIMIQETDSIGTLSKTAYISC